MPQYAYRAVDKDSHVSNGILVSDSVAMLERRMAELGLWLIEAKEHTAKAQSYQPVRANRKDLVDFFNGLATLVGAGIDIAESLRVLVEETQDEGLRRVLEDVRLNIESGVSFYEAMSSHPEVFNAEICNLIRAGEYSGRLIETCYDIGHHLEWVDQLMADVQQATIYPSLVGIAVLGLIFLMFSFVVPQFAEIFDSLNLELPAITQVVVAVGAFCNDYWWLVLCAIGGLIGVLKFGPRYLPSLALALDRFKLRMPIFGKLNQLLTMSRFSHNMGLMLRSGISIVDALELVKGIVGNRVMTQAVQDAQMAVTEGRRMSQALIQHQIVSPIVMRMIVVGEETGQLDLSLEKVSTRFDNEIPRRIKRLFGILEPMIIMILLGVVGVVAAAIFLPLFSLMSGLS